MCAFVFKRFVLKHVCFNSSLQGEKCELCCTLLADTAPTRGEMSEGRVAGKVLTKAEEAKERKT